MLSFWIRYCLLALVSAALLCARAEAYEVETHKKLSEEAAKQSDVEAFLPVIGLNSLNDPLSDIDKKLNVLDWFKLGADEEDDTISANFARYRNHFYDSQHSGAGYSYGPLIGEPSPDWALEDTRTFTTQSYSFKRARQYFYDALTLSNNNREMWMARTFYTLGHVIHHIEDMAQPQHTRNDSHGGFVLGPKSRYELYTDKHRGELPFSDQYYNATNPVRFDTARNFWATGAGKGMAEFSSYNFLSAGTNFDTSLYPYPRRADAIAHDEPANPLLESVGAGIPPECQTPNPPCVMTFYTTHINDNYRQVASADNPHTSTESIFDQDLKANNHPLAFSLNRFNFDAAHEFLIPRAVAYSAGLIDYFFRGRLEAEDVTFTDTGITLKVKNAIDPQKTPAWANETLYVANSQQQPSTLTIAYEYRNAAGKTQYGVSNTVAMTAEPDGTNGIAPGQSSQNVYSFTLSVPAEVTEVKYRLVFRGRLGQEDEAVAVGPADPVSGFVFSPSYVPEDGISGSRVIHNRGGQWQLTDQQNKVAGNIDWKGWYRNGKPTKVLSWVGPESRYFPKTYDPKVAGYSSPRDTKIFQNGEVFAIGPPVSGAALTRDSAGKEWLVLISYDGRADVVYRRPNVKSNSPAGWQEIGRFYHDPALLNAANTPWFFNGSGTEAQTIRSGYKAGDPRLRLFRLKISIVDNTATFANEGNLDNDANVGAFTGTSACNETQSATGACTANCSGAFAQSALSEYRTTILNTWSGSNIIAVDYIQDTPVFATYSSATNTTYAFNRSWRSSLNTSCNGSLSVSTCRTNSSSEVKDTRHVEKQFNTVEKISMSSFGDIIMQSVTGTLQIDATKTDSKINNNTLPTVIDQSGGGNFEYTTSRLRYLDLRYGLYSLYSQTRASSGQATNVDVDFYGGPFGGHVYTVFLPRRTTIKQVTGFGGEIPVHQIDETGDVVPYDLDDYKLITQCNSTMTNPGIPQPVYMDPGTILIGGSWAVDSNGNLFLSESKLDKDMRGIGAFNYLTGATEGDPGHVIPTAPQGVYYYNGIGVIE